MTYEVEQQKKKYFQLQSVVLLPQVVVPNRLWLYKRHICHHLGAQCQR